MRVVNVATTPTTAHMPRVDKEGSCQCIDVGKLLQEEKAKAAAGNEDGDKAAAKVGFSASTGVCWSPNDSLLRCVWAMAPWQ